MSAGPNLTEFEALLAEDAAATAADIDADQYYQVNVDRVRDAHRALLNIRPTDRVVLAAWLRWMAREEQGIDEQYRPGLEHIASQLELRS